MKDSVKGFIETLVSRYFIFGAGIPKTYSSRDKDNAAPDLTRTCNEYWMQGPDNHYDMPQIRDR